MDSITKTVTIGEDTYVFKRLSVEDLLSIQDEIVAAREKLAVDLANEMKMLPFEIFNVKLDIRSRKPSFSDILDSARSPHGACSIIKKAMDKSGFSHAQKVSALRDIRIGDCAEIAQNLILDVHELPKPKEETKEAVSPLPQPAVASAVATSGE